MLRKRKEPKRKSIALSLMRDVRGSAAEKLRMFEKMRAAGGFANEHPADLAEAEKSCASSWRWRRGVEGTGHRPFEIASKAAARRLSQRDR
jgi:hypothetical protein